MDCILEICECLASLSTHFPLQIDPKFLNKAEIWAARGANLEDAGTGGMSSVPFMHHRYGSLMCVVIVKLKR